MGRADPVNILLVDDQPAKLLSYEVMLEELGEMLIKASSGREALAQLLKTDVAVILIDVSMPELDGFELAAMIREHPRFQSTAIIFVSAIHLSDIDRLRGYEAGAVDYLPVPVVPALLRARVRVFCDLYRKTRELKALNSELEARVAERTRELESANAELELRVESRTREREEALAQVAEMQKLESLGQLTGGLAHDFNNLLMVVLGNLQLARKHVVDMPELASRLERACDAAEAGAVLTKRMLAFARRQVLKPESVALEDVVPGVVEMMAHSLGPGVRIEVDVSVDLPPIVVDRNQLEVALLNLGLNARDAMPEGGKLSIAARLADENLPEALGRGQYVILSVADTGVGMDAATLKRASEPFFTTKGAGKGSGLGLSMVHGLSQQSGGTMRITSYPGAGSTISLWLPVSSVEALQPSGVPPSVPSSLVSRRVLVVDDDPLVLTSTADLLRELGHEPIKFSSPAQALSFLKANAAPDIAIVDFAMPEMTGVELARKIGGLCPNLPVLLATGYADGAETSGLPRLDKPFSLDELAYRVELLSARVGRKSGAGV
jgi:signal transduction histidine kinase